MSRKNENQTENDNNSPPNSAELKVDQEHHDEDRKVDQPNDNGKATLPAELARKNKLLIIATALLSVVVLGLILLLIFSRASQRQPLPAPKQQSTTASEIEKPTEEVPFEVVGTPTCPDGYKVDGEVCTKITRITATETSTCPDGTDDIGRAEICGVYVGEAEPYQECPNGTIFKIEAKTKLYCFTKARTNVEACGEFPWSGSYFDAASHKCYYATVEAQALSRCQDYKVVHKNRCYEPKVKKITYSCPDGYSLDNRECVMVEKTEQKKRCPDGYNYSSGNNKCLKK